MVKKIAKTADERLATTGSPVHRVVWSNEALEEFMPGQIKSDARVDSMVAASIAALQANLKDGTAYDAQGKISKKSIADLGKAGFWGARVETKYGGCGANFPRFAKMVSEVAAAGFATEAGVAGIHAGIGAVHSISMFGNEYQKSRFLPSFASGEKLSGFGLTEKGAGTDVTNIQMTARREGDYYYVSGEKIFVGNARPGQTLALVCKVEGEEKPAVFICEFPDQEDETFQNNIYDIYAVRQFYNRGFRLKNFKIPAVNRLEGANIHYHGLNYGRVLVCANGAGAMRLILRSICGKSSWGEYRQTYSQPIQDRSLVKQRIARLAGLIVGADALRDWSSTKLEAGYRGELECLVAKIFSANAVAEAAIWIGLRTHGGRLFLRGHMIGDNLHDMLAPLIYEGENQMLAMKFFSVLAQAHGKEYLEPIGNGLKALKSGKLSGLGQVAGAAAGLSVWRLKQELKAACKTQHLEGMDSRLQAHVNFALKHCAKLSLAISKCMSKHGKKLINMQARIENLSMRVQDTIVMLVSCMHAHKSGSKGTIAAADILCQTTRQKLTGKQPSDAFYADCDRLADLVIKGEFEEIEGAALTTILQQYKN